MKGSSTITNFPAGSFLTEPFEEDSEGEPEDDFTTVLPVTVRPAHQKSIPFGTTLSERPLRVQYGPLGEVVLTTRTGGRVPLTLLPDWEQKELSRHLRFAVQNGAL